MKKTKEEKNKIVAIVGPTASGKSAWAKIFAQEFGGKVISVDSRQVYRGMDIGTAKDKTFSQDMIDVADPSHTFTVAEFSGAVNNLINQYLQAKQLPILAGGTGLYLNAIIYGYVLPNLKNESLKIRQELAKLSESELFEKLKQLDPVSAEKIDPKNLRRVIRALEVTILSEKPFSELQKKLKPKFKTLLIGIEIPREKLYAKIDSRVDEQIKEGLIEEVRKLLSKFPADLPAFNTIGYKEIIDYIKNKIPLKEAIDQIKFHTHDYVRRQMTWFRKNPDIKWVKNIEEARVLIKKFLKNA